MRKSVGLLGSGLKSLSASLAGVVGTAGIAALVRSTVNAGDELQKLRIRLGATTEALSEYKFAADKSGVSFNTVTMGLQRMTRRVNEAANGTGEAKGALEELNISAAALTRLKPEDQFEALADALAGVNGEADRVRLAMKLFDSEGVALLQMMERGGAGIREMREEARRLGLTVTGEAADSMAAFNDRITELQGTAKGFVVQLVSEMSPELERLAKWFQEVLPVAIDFTMKSFLGLQGTVKVVQVAFELLLKEVAEFLSRIPGASDAVAKLTGAGLADWAEGSRQAAAELTLELDEVLKRIDGINNRPAVAPPTAGSGGGGNGGGASGGGAGGVSGDLSLNTGSNRFAVQVTEELQAMDRWLVAREEMRTQNNRFVVSAEEGSKKMSRRFKAEVTEMTESGKAMADTIGRSIETAVGSLINGTGEAADVFRSFAADVVSELAKVAAKAAATRIISSVFGGGRAEGGPVTRGRAFLVGEKGPELFVPGRSGTIVPNAGSGGRSGAAGSGAAGSVTINIVNNTGGRVEAQERRRTDGDRYVVDVVLNALQTNPFFRNQVAAAR